MLIYNCDFVTSHLKKSVSPRDNIDYLRSSSKAQRVSGLCASVSVSPCRRVVVSRAQKSPAYHRASSVFSYCRTVVAIQTMLRQQVCRNVTAIRRELLQYCFVQPYVHAG